MKPGGGGPLPKKPGGGCMERGGPIIMPSGGGKAPGGKLGGNMPCMGTLRGPLLGRPGGGTMGGRWGGICWLTPPPPPAMGKECIGCSSPGGGGRCRICVGWGRSSGGWYWSSKKPGGPCPRIGRCWGGSRSCRLGPGPGLAFMGIRKMLRRAWASAWACACACA